MGTEFAASTRILSIRPAAAESAESSTPFRLTRSWVRLATSWTRSFQPFTMSPTASTPDDARPSSCASAPSLTIRSAIPYMNVPNASILPSVTATSANTSFRADIHDATIDDFRRSANLARSDRSWLDVGPASEAAGTATSQTARPWDQESSALALQLADVRCLLRARAGAAQRAAAAGRRRRSTS